MGLDSADAATLVTRKGFHHEGHRSGQNGRSRESIKVIARASETALLLFEDAVVKLFAFPVGGGLDEGQDYGMRVFLGGRELRLE